MMHQKNNGFSLVEITVAIGIVAFALLAIVGMIPVGLNSSRDAVDDSRTSMIALDAYNRICARMNSNSSSNADRFVAAYSTGQASYFYYTSEGIFNPNNAGDGYLNKVSASGDAPQYYTANFRPSSPDFYRAKVVVSQFAAPVPTADPSDPRLGTDMLCATIQIGWPVKTADGSVIGTNNSAKASYVFYLRKP